MKGLNIAMIPFKLVGIALLVFIAIYFVVVAEGGITSLLDQIDVFIAELI